MLKQKNSKIQSNVGLGTAIGYFVKLGYIVCVPLTDSQDYDIIIDNGKLEKVQVKTTYHKSPGGKYVVELRTKTHWRNKQYSFKSIGKVDYVFVLTQDNQKYLIPKKAIKAQVGLTLNEDFDKFLVN